jgi:hypothetical protein
VSFEKHLGKNSWREILKSYNVYYNTSWVFEDICKHDIILWNSWIVPTLYFKELMDTSSFFRLPLEKQLIPQYSGNFNNLAYVFEIFHGFIFMILTEKYHIKWSNLNLKHVAMLEKTAV